ncbi:MAG: FeoA family protein [Elusimicrobiota bacterium]
MNTRKTLAQMKKNEYGKVVEIRGGFGIRSRLENMGVRIGVEIKKTNQQLLRGPVVIRVGNTQVGIGYGMAQKIVIETGKQ